MRRFSRRAYALSSLAWLVFSMLSLCAITSPASAQIVADDPVHQQLLSDLLTYDRDAFEVSKTEGFVTRARPEAAKALKARFARIDVSVSDEQARAVVEQMMLRAKGRSPANIPPASLTLPFSDKHRTLHGHLAEVDIVASNPARYGFSKGNSISADGSIYSDGKVTGGWQSKCYATTEASRDGSIEGFAKFLREEYRVSSKQPYEAFIPRDQYESLRRAGVINEDGRFRDLADLRKRVDECVGRARSDGYDDHPLVKAALLKTGENAKGFTVDTMRQFQLRPQPDTYEGYRTRVAELPKQARIGKHTAPNAGRRAGKGTAITAALIAISADAYGASHTSPRAIEIAQSGAGVLSELEQLKRLPKPLKDGLSKLPRGVQKLFPSASSLSKVGRLAGKATAVITALLVSRDIYSYASGSTTVREFSAAMGSTAGGIGGGMAGVAIGAAIGGPFAPATAVIGGIAGGIAGAFFSESAVASYWDSLDDADRVYALELFKAKIRAAGFSAP
jgi:hypothetical protein